MQLRKVHGGEVRQMLFAISNMAILKTIIPQKHLLGCQYDPENGTKVDGAVEYQHGRHCESETRRWRIFVCYQLDKIGDKISLPRVASRVAGIGKPQR